MIPAFPHPASSKKKAHTVLMLSTLFVVFALVLSACGGGGSSSTTKKERPLRIAAQIGADYVKNFSPFAPSGTVPGTEGMIYETLYYFNTYNGDEKPVLATQYKWNSDNTEVTFNLRTAKWSDGKDFTSKDVVFTLDMLKKYPVADTDGVWQYIDTVTAPDDHTVVVKFKQNYPPALWFVAGRLFIVPEHIFGSAGDPTKFTNENPVGTGPYKLEKFTTQLVTYVKNPSFWGADQVKVAKLEYATYKDNNVVQQELIKGNVDWGGFFAPDLDNTFVAKDPENNHYWMAPVAFNMIYVNLTKAPFNDVAVRHAISDALDRTSMSKQAVSGYVPNAHPAMVTPGQIELAAPEYKDLAFTRDVAKANKTLDDAGYKKGPDGIRLDKNGKKMSYSILVPAGWTDWEQICQIISQNVKEIGIEIKPTPIDQNAYFSARNNGNYDVIMGSSPLRGPSPFYMYNSILNSANTADVGKPATTNWARWKDATTDKLLKQLASTTDPTVQKEALAGLQKIMVEQQPVILLLSHPSWYEYTTKNFTGFPSKENPYALGATYEVPDNEQVVLNLKPVS